MTDPTSGPAGPSDVPGLVAAPGSGPVSERMRALLSKAVDEQVQEQRAVSSVLQDLRGQVGALSEAVSRTASGAGVERVAADLASLAGDLRTSTASLGTRLEALGRRVDEQAGLAASSGQGGEATALRLASLAEEVEASSRTLGQLEASVALLGGFPDALAAVQQDVAGLSDRLAPLADVRAALDDLAGRNDADALRPDLEALRTRVEALPGAAELSRSRDSVVEAVSGRLERLEALAGRPVVAPDALEAAVGRIGGRLDELATAAPVLDRLGPLEQRLG
ncbi:MAG: hypothetical protein JWN17_1221, partial [Frankiales bacterium]|nr:hypothetical protein [Frankiales bacterium]